MMKTKKKKKMLRLMLVVMLVMSAAAVPAYAAEEAIDESASGVTNGGTVMPLWDTVSSATANLSIGYDGTAKCIVKVVPKISASIDKISANVKLLRSNGIEENGWNQSMEKFGVSFMFDESDKVTSKGDYYISATLHCYKNGVLVSSQVKCTFFRHKIHSFL